MPERVRRPHEALVGVLGYWTQRFSVRGAIAFSPEIMPAVHVPLQFVCVHYFVIVFRAAAACTATRTTRYVRCPCVRGCDDGSPRSGVDML
jgi:hypothetical protein